MTDTTLDNGETDTTTSNNDNQADTTTVKTYTQDEVNNMMSKQKSIEERKATKRYEELGDFETLQTIVSEATTRKQEEEIAKGNFEKTLKEVVDKKDAQIASLKDTVKGYKITQPLLDAAAKHRANAPDQVQQLLVNQVNYTQDGEVQVVDANKAVRYKETGDLFTVDDLVAEFLGTNPHFVQPGKSTTNSNSSSDSSSVAEFDYDNVDPSRMKDPKYYAQYAAARKKHGLQ